MTETARSKKKCGPPNGIRVGLTKKGLLTISVKGLYRRLVRQPAGSKNSPYLNLADHVTSGTLRGS